MTLSVEVNKIEFAYDISEKPLFRNLTLHIAPGWTGVVGANGAGKTTFLKLATGLLAPGKGRIMMPPERVYCSQRTDTPPDNFGKFLESLDKSALVVKGRLEIETDWARRWTTLSHGERKRAQIGTAIWLGIRLPDERSRRDLLLNMPAGSLSLGGGKELSYPVLAIRPDDRIGITGPNGAGKSTLIRTLATVLNAPEERVVCVPQEIAEIQAREILYRVRALPPARKGMLMTIVSRLGSQPDRFLESTTPSPGEVRKLVLALGMIREPHIILMDEPTNHMDLPSVECLEQALSDYPGALVLISHDRRFLEALTVTHWHVSRESAGMSVLEVMRSH